ncbi:MAG: diaminohydroxyphosphoribosylaminopyrimidine deaminase [Flavobacteriaceae bacterium]
MSTDEKYMARCLQLASLGKGLVSPNPLVGAVIVFKGSIIGEGYHQSYGGPHAEVNAINSVKDKSVLDQSTIYVSLEPCAHHGKTPPCADLLVEHKLKRVVIGCTDTFSEVSGRGIKRLQQAGIAIELDVLVDECREMNNAFFTFHEKKRPFVLLKWAETKNRLIDSNSGIDGEVSWISAPEMQVRVHTWRNDFQAILVGKNTILKDNPALTVRAVEGLNPIRIILDSQLELPESVRAKNSEAPTIVLNLIEDKKDTSTEYIKIERMSVSVILEALYQKNIQSILVEGGSAALQSFIDSNLWDEARVLVGNSSFESGTKAPALAKELHYREILFGEQINYYKNK